MRSWLNDQLGERILTPGSPWSDLRTPENPIAASGSPWRDLPRPSWPPPPLQREEGDDDDDDDDDDHDRDDATKIKNESMLGELRIYVKVLDEEWHFFGPRRGDRHLVVGPATPLSPTAASWREIALGCRGVTHDDGGNVQVFMGDVDGWWWWWW